MSGLDVRSLEVHRAGFPIVRGVDLTVEPGRITVLLGPNGAGKTTLLEALSGRIPATSGAALLEGVDVLRMSRRARAKRGLAHVESCAVVADADPVRARALFGIEAH